MRIFAYFKYIRLPPKQSMYSTADVFCKLRSSIYHSSGD